MAQPIIEFRHVTFQYETADAPVLRDISLSVEAGETVLVLGPSGCGKSTLLLCLNGIIPRRIAGRFSGRVTVAGLNVADHQVHEMALKVGLVFQDPEAQFSTLYVEDEVAFGLENLRYPRDEIRRRVERALGQVGLSDKMGQRLDRLSGGEKQKVALASVLAMDPEILALDAPTANLDPVSARDFLATLRWLKDELGKTVIIVEQHVDDLMDTVDRLVLFNRRGEIIAHGPPRQIARAIGSEALEEHGIWTPQVWSLVDSARRWGLPIETYPLTVEEAYAELAPFIGDRLPHNGFVPRPESTTGPEIIRVRGLSHTYPTAVQALDEVHLSVQAGDFCAIVGRNGAGKTTLARYMTRILDPPPGTVFLGDRDVTDLSLTAVAGQVGYVFQNPEHQFVEDTVHDELAFSLQVRGADDGTVRNRVQEMLETFQLGSLSRRHPFELSQGEKRRLSVAATVTARPQVLILDEPTLALDRATAVALMETIRRLNEDGTTVIFITHDMRLVTEYARSVAVMAGGRVIFQGTVPALFDRPDILAAASLLPPPIVALVQRFRQADPTFPLVTSERAFVPFLEVAARAVSGR